MKLMKMLTFALLLLVSFSGCYTIVWSPGERIEKNEEIDTNERFYETRCYGSPSPWWYYYLEPEVNYRPVRDRNGEETRNAGDRNPGGGTEPIIETGRAGSNESNGSGSGSGGNQNSKGQGETKRTNSENNGTNNTQSNERKSSDERPERNSGSGRSDGKGRR